MAKQVFDLREGKGMSAGQSTEHLRNYSVTEPDMKKFGYYDPTRVNLNFEVGKGGVIKPVNKNYSTVQRFKDNLRNRGIEDPNEIKRKKGMEPNRNTVANIVLGGSREQMHKLAFGEQQVDISKGADNRHIVRQPEIEKWAQDMYNFIAKRFGEENIIAFIVHLDEKNPHIHCTLVPVNEKIKISYNSVFGKNKEQARRTFLNLHDEVGKVNEKWNLERGSDNNTTGVRHRTSEEYWQWLKDKCEEMEGEKAGKETELDFLDKELRRTDIKVKGLTKMLENISKRRSDILEEIQQLEDDANKGRDTNDDIRQQIQRLNHELKEVEDKIKDKKEKLVYRAVSKETAEAELDKLDSKWGEQYPIVIKSWRDNWERLTEYTKEIRRLIYTTNTVEGYHRQVRKVTKNKGVFPSDTALEKLVYLAYRNISEKWTMPLANWALISQQLAIKFGDRFEIM